MGTNYKGNIPDLLDSNSYLLRDYSSLIRNLITKLPNLTNKWTDYSISEPDTIFLNNISYLNDLISYSIDYRYILTSVKYTSNYDFINSINILTGSSIPFYKETYNLVINRTNGSGVELIKKGTVMYDSTGSYAVTTISDVLILPNSLNYVPVVEGNIYYQNLHLYRKSKIESNDAINNNTIIDLDSYNLIDREFDSSEVVFDYLVNKSNKYLISKGDESSLLLSPMLPYNRYKFVGYSIESENVLSDDVDIINSEFSDLSIKLSKSILGIKPKDINDYKVSYYESLQKIFTDINPNIFYYNYSTSNKFYDDLDKIFIKFNNNRDKFLSGVVNYTEGYIEITRGLISGYRLLIGYDYYRNSEGHAKLNHYELSTTINSIPSTINLELDEGCTIKEYSILLKIIGTDSKKYYVTDYDGKLVVPQGSICNREYLYKFYDNRSYDLLDFSPGVCLSNITKIHVKDFIGSNDTTSSVSSDYHKILRVSDELGLTDKSHILDKASSKIIHISTRNNINNSIITKPIGLVILTKISLDVYIKGKLYNIPPNNTNAILLDDITEKDLNNLEILSKDKSPLYIIKTTTDPSVFEFNLSNNYVYIDPRVLDTNNTIPNVITYDQERIYYLVTSSNSPEYKLFSVNDKDQLFITLDGICSYYYTPSIYKDRVPVYLNDSVVWYIYSAPISKYYTTEYGIPKNISVKIVNNLDYNKDIIYNATLDSNESNKNYYNAIISSNITNNSIDLYNISKKLTRITLIPIYVEIDVYVKPLDKSNINIEDIVKSSIINLFDNLEAGEPIYSASILSRVLHSTNYIAYAILTHFSKDDLNLGRSSGMNSIDPKDNSKLLILGDLRVNIKNSDIILF